MPYSDFDEGDPAPTPPDSDHARKGGERTIRRASRLGVDSRIAVLIAVLMSSFYLWRMLPGPGFAGDTLKLQFVGPTAGTAHETGYPIYLMLTWLASRVPIGQIAWRVNAVSALFAVVACVLVFFVLRELRTNRSVAFAFSIGLGLVPFVLVYAVVAEVYTLHLALLLGMLLVLLLWQERRDDWQLYLLIALAALSFANHLTTSLLIPGILIYLWRVDRHQAFSRRMVLVAGIAAMASMSTYGYLLWRSSDPSVFYLEIAPHSFGDLVDIWTGGRFRGQLFDMSADRVLNERLPELGLLLGVSFIAVVLPIVYGYRVLRRSPVAVLLFWWGGITFVFSVGYRIPDIAPYLIPLAAVLVVFAGVGAEPFADRWIQSRSFRVVLLVGAVIALGPPSVAMSLTDWSESAVIEEDTRYWLTTLSSDALLVANYGTAMGAWNLMSIGDVSTSVDVLHVWSGEFEEDENGVLDSYMRGNRAYSHQLRQVIDAGKQVFAPTNEWMCVLVSHGFALTEAGDRLYRVTTARYEIEPRHRLSDDMRETCLEIDSDYGDL